MWLTCASAGAGSNDATPFRQHEGRFNVERRKARMRHGGAKAGDVGDLNDLAAVAGGQGRAFAQDRRHADLVRREVAAASSLHRRRHDHGHRHDHHRRRHRHCRHGKSNFEHTLISSCNSYIFSFFLRCEKQFNKISPNFLSSNY